MRNALSALLTAINGQLDAANILDGSLTGDQLQAAIRDAAGINSTGVVRRGKSVVAAEHSRTSTTYGKLGATPGTDQDQVSSVVVPANALVLVGYQALWKCSGSTPRAALFIGANQLKRAVEAAVPAVQEAAPGTMSTDSYGSLSTYHAGLISGNIAPTPAGSDVATGQVLGLVAGGTPQGGFCVIDNLVGGTYDFSIQFKSATGSVSAKERRLKVLVLGF